MTDSTVSVRVFDKRGELVGPIEMRLVEQSDEAWREQLGEEAYRITRGAGTERAFCGTLLDNKTEGVYVCVCCGLPLFSSAHKFDSGSGWPSFFQPIAPENLVETLDTTLGMARTEITCTRCLAHMGHVFPDGPAPSGMRYCLNSESLTFTDIKHVKSLADPAAT